MRLKLTYKIIGASVSTVCEVLKSCHFGVLDHAPDGIFWLDDGVEA